jgi:DNA-binding NarL/FixJ family response regulator
MTETARIFLIDDHPAVRQGLALLLALDQHQICGEAGNRQEMLQALPACNAQLALLDLSLGEDSGLELIADLRQAGIPVLVYSMFEDPATISQAFAYGAQGYVCKREVSEVLLSAVHTVLRGEQHASPLASNSLTSRTGATEAGAGELLLSERELQTILLIGQGCSNQEVAETLALSVRTIESYCARASEKLGLAGMKELRRFAMQHHHKSPFTHQDNPTHATD